MDDTTIIAEPDGAVTAYLEVTESSTIAPGMLPLQDEIVIGRDRQDALGANHFLCLPEQTVSRRHARIRRRGDAFYVEDLHSFNGTFLLGERVAPGVWHPLHDGDEVAVASTLMVFHSMLETPVDSAPSVIKTSVDATSYTRDVADTAHETDVEQTLARLRAMAQVSIALGAVKDRETLIEKIMSFIFTLFPAAERAIISLSDCEGETPVPLAVRRRDGDTEPSDHVKLSRTITNEVLGEKRAILSFDTLADRHFAYHASIVVQAIRSVMCVPLLVGDEVLGLIQVDTSSDPNAFTAQDLEILTGVCAETAVALRNFQLYSEVERLLDGFVRASVQAIEERDPVTAGHSFRVAAYADRLARAVDQSQAGTLRRVRFSTDQLREIRYAALLHDFGKVGVREHVLRKEKKLHHADMLLLEQRFRYARACMECEAYRRLSESQRSGGASANTFRDEKARIDRELSEEFARLNAFLETIRLANEPAIHETEPPPELAQIVHYNFRAPDDTDEQLLDLDALSALSISKGCLTPAERRQIESHVVDSYAFLVLIPWTRDLASVPSIAHGHHEKLDGSGYPLGLQGGQIGIETRILTLCDIYDALTAGDRPYKKAVPPGEALDLLEAECNAGLLDRRLFDVFVDAKAWETT